MLPVQELVELRVAALPLSKIPNQKVEGFHQHIYVSLHHHRHLGAGHVPADGAGRQMGQEQQGGVQRAVQVGECVCACPPAHVCVCARARACVCVCVCGPSTAPP